MTPKHVLVINVSRIGDTLLATPAIRAMARAWPEAKIDVLGHPGRAEVLCHLPFIRRVGTISKKSAPLRGWLDYLTPPYDLAVVYGYDKALVAYALRVSRQVVAFRQNDKHLDQRLTPAVTPPPFQSIHAVDLAMTLPAAIGVNPAGHRIAYAVSLAEQEWAKRRLAIDLPYDVAMRVGLQIASFPTKGYRDWPVDNFIALSRRILEEKPRTHFLIFGGGAERARTEALVNALGESATSFAGHLSLRETGALMSQLDLYVGVDTGPTHLMSAFDIPLVGLYHGYSRSELIAPLEHPCFFAVDHPLAGPNCTTDVSMADISVDTVFAKVIDAMRTHSL